MSEGFLFVKVRAVLSCAARQKAGGRGGEEEEEEEKEGRDGDRGSVSPNCKGFVLYRHVLKHLHRRMHLQVLYGEEGGWKGSVKNCNIH